MKTTQPELLAELEAAWSTTDALFGLLADEAALLEAPIPLRHPSIFYLGHLPAFAWNQVGRGVLGRGDFRADFDELFERGIDPPDEQSARAVAISEWPAVEQVLAYRDGVREALRELWDEVAAVEDEPLARRQRVYALVLEHELMHHETFAYMLRELDDDRKRAPREAPGLVLGGPPTREVCSIPAGHVLLGASFDDVPFGWDNEFPEQQVEVAEFGLDRYPVTVQDYRRFIDGGGYRQARFWRPEDWAWLGATGKHRPHGWFERGGQAFMRTMFGRAALDEVGGWPVLVTCAEALAYARWKGGRLATEPELQRAALGDPSGVQRSYPWGDDPPAARHGNFGLQRYDPVPVGSHPAGRSAFGADELAGNGWEWTASDFAGFPGFEAWMRTYPGYSADFFAADHAVLYGAAWPTSPRLLRASFRNWFRRTYPWVFATFRLAYDR